MAECGEALATSRRLRTAKARAARDAHQAARAAEAGLTLAEYRSRLMRELALKSAQARRLRRLERLRLSAVLEAAVAELDAERDCE